MVDHTKWLKDKHDPDDPIQKLAVWTEMTYDGPNPPDSDGPEIKMDLAIKIHRIKARKETPFLKTDPTSS